jgi:hypothetical protein
MRLGTRSLVLVVCVVAVAGCGGARTISADSAAKTLRQAGFSKPGIGVIPPADVRKGQLAFVSVSHPHVSPRWPVARVIVYRSSRAAQTFFRTGC